MTIDVMRDVEAIARMDVVPTILDMVCRSTGMGFAAVARVTEEQWIACAVRDSIAFGLAPGGELPLETTLCNEIRQSGCLVVIDHVAEDDRYRTHRTPALYGFQSYISVPIRRTNGHFFGTLCAIDPKPARLQHGDTIAMFTLFADLIGRHLDAQEPFTRNQNALADEREASKLRDQFLAVLGHDLREPLAAIQAGASLLKKTASDDRSAHVAEVIERSVGRMGSLIQNVMDFARGRFGGWANRLERFAATFACRAAVKAGDTLSQAEMRELLLQLFATDLPPHDVHGRSTIVQLPREELERRFGRR